MTGDLAPERVLPLLRTRWLGRPYRFLAACTSTSDEAARADGDGLLVVADAQTGGRGRLGRSWHSPPGENLYLSLRLRPDLAPPLIPPLTLLVGAAVAEALAAGGAAPRLKWPNDVLLPTPAGLRKAAGILTEMATGRGQIRHLVVGLGIDVNGAAFPGELADRATSLRLSTGRAWDRGALLAGILNTLEPAYERFVAEGPADALARWRAFGLLGARCRVEGLEGVASDVDADGALLLTDDAGRVHRIVSGEIGSATVPAP